MLLEKIDSVKSVKTRKIMKDIQNQNDNRKIPLQKVGVKGLEYPIVVLDKKIRQKIKL